MCKETFGQFLGPGAEVEVEETEFKSAFSQDEPLPFVEDLITSLEDSLKDAL